MLATTFGKFKIYYPQRQRFKRSLLKAGFYGNLLFVLE